MATQKYGPLGPFSGRLGNVVGYVVNGQQRLRSIGERSYENPSDKQKEAWLRTALATKFLSPITEFISMGFDLKSRIKGDNYFNMASASVRQAITGTYPDLQIDCSKVIVSEGEMPATLNPQVTVVEGGLLFSWDKTQTGKGIWSTDQAMLLAYRPEKERADYTRSGHSRKQGEAFLPLGVKPGKSYLETYLTFISEDHKSISTSIYLGRIFY